MSIISIFCPVVLLMAVPFLLSAQVPCAPGQDSVVHQLSDDKLQLNNDGTIISGLSGDHDSAMRNVSLWITGADPNGNIITSIRHGQRNDWRAGLTGYYDDCIDFDRIHHITADDMSRFRHLQATARQNNRPIDCDAIPLSILMYPAYGNTNVQDSILTQLTRPYFYDQPEAGMDFGDGIYDPCAGDYPIGIIECNVNNRASQSAPSMNDFISEVSVYALTNDWGINAILMHFTLAFDCVDPIHIIALRMNSLADTDYIRSGVSIHIPLADDQETAYSQSTECPLLYTNRSTEDVPTISSISYLRGPLIGFYFLRDSINQVIRDDTGQPIYDYSFINTRDPDTLIQLSSFSHYLPVYDQPGLINDETYLQMGLGNFSDGTPITYGGTGYDTTSTAYTKYAFEGTPYDNNTWTTESLLSENRPSGLLLGLQQGTLRAGAINDHLFMLRTGSIDPNDLTTSTATYINDTEKWLEEILPYCNRDVCSVLTSTDQEETSSSSRPHIWPNPVQSRLMVDTYIEGTYTIYSTMGQDIQSGTISSDGIDVSILPSSTYILELRSRDGDASSNGFIKQ